MVENLVQLVLKSIRLQGVMIKPDLSMSRRYMNEPARDYLILITLASHEGPDEPEHLLSLARAFDSRIPEEGSS